MAYRTGLSPARIAESWTSLELAEVMTHCAMVSDGVSSAPRDQSAEEMKDALSHAARAGGHNVIDKTDESEWRR